MDQRIRTLEKRAKQGDIDACRQWMVEAGRTEDMATWVEAFKLLGELECPGMMETLRQIKQIEEMIESPPVEEGYWTTEITIVDNTGGLEIEPYHGLNITTHTGL